MTTPRHLDGEYWHDLTFRQPKTPQYLRALLHQLEPLLMPLLVGTPWHQAVQDTARLIVCNDGSGHVKNALSDATQRLVKLLELREPPAEDDASANLAADHAAAALAVTWIARERDDIAMKLTQWEIGVPATVTALLRARAVPDPVVSVFAQVAGTVDSVVLYECLQRLDRHTPAPQWLINATIGWARTSYAPQRTLDTVIKELIADERDRPFTAAQADIVAALLQDGLSAADIAGAARALA